LGRIKNIDIREYLYTDTFAVKDKMSYMENHGREHQKVLRILFMRKRSH
jgi:hypothetical protein